MTHEEAKKIGATHTDNYGYFYFIDNHFIYRLENVGWVASRLNRDMTGLIPL